MCLREVGQSARMDHKGVTMSRMSKFNSSASKFSTKSSTAAGAVSLQRTVDSQHQTPSIGDSFLQWHSPSCRGTVVVALNLEVDSKVEADIPW
jgi:hypothetical protein